MTLGYEWRDIFELLDGGLSVLEARVLLELEESLVCRNFSTDRDGNEREWTNIVTDVSVSALARDTKATEAHVEKALERLDELGRLDWFRRPQGEDEATGELHAYKFPEPTQAEIDEQHIELARKRRRHEEELRIERAKRERKKAEKLAKQRETTA